VTSLLIVTATLVGSITLNARHQRRLRRLDGRRHRAIVLPTITLYPAERLTAAEADALKAEWLKHRNDPPTWWQS